jgi:hypothetical protein
MPKINTNIGIDTGIGGGVSSQSLSYWKQRFPSDLVASVKSDTEIDLYWTNNGTPDYTGHKIYISTDNINFTLKDTIASIGTTHTIDGLTANTLYYFYTTAYKGSHESIATNVVSDTTVFFADNFIGTTINTDKWDETDGDSVISQNGMVLLTLPHVANITEFTNILKSKKTIASGVAVAQGHLTWITDGASVSIGGIYLFKDANNWASITSRATTAGDKYRLRIYTSGISRYDLNTAAIITKNKYVKIWTDGTIIKFYYWSGSVWTQMGTSQTFGLGYPLCYAISVVDNVAFTGGNPVIVRNAILSSFEYTKLYSPIANIDRESISNIAWCWFNSPKPTYDFSVNKTWLNLVQNPDGSGFSQYVATLDHTNKIVTKVKVGSVYQSDDHNEGSILVRTSDGKLFTAYTEHTKTGSPLRFRISTNAKNASAWGNEITSDPDNPNLYSYANTFEVSNGNIYVIYRSTHASPANNTWRYIVSSDGGATWSTSTTIFNYTTSPYMRIFQSTTNKDLLHFIGCPHPILGTATTKILHFYFDTGAGTWHKSDGTDITVGLPLDDSDATIVVSKNYPEQLWIEDLMLDSNGYPRILFTYYTDIDTHAHLKFLYYTEWTGSKWSEPYEIHQSCHKNIASTNPSSEDTYMPLATFDRGNVNRIFAAKEISDGGILEIFELIRVSASSFTSTRKTTQGNLDQWRPITTNAPTYNVMWLNKIDYTSYVSFIQQLMIETF